MPVATLRTMIEAPGRAAPCASVIVPWMAPPTSWAEAVAAPTASMSTRQIKTVVRRGKGSSGEDERPCCRRPFIPQLRSPCDSHDTTHRPKEEKNQNPAVQRALYQRS